MRPSLSKHLALEQVHDRDVGLCLRQTQADKPDIHSTTESVGVPTQQLTGDWADTESVTADWLYRLTISPFQTRRLQVRDTGPKYLLALARPAPRPGPGDFSER